MYIPTAIGDLFNKLFEVLETLVTNIINGFKELLVFLFVPEQENLQAKIDNQMAKFGFVSEAQELFSSIKNMITEETEPPTINIDLSAVGSAFPYNIGTTAIVLDLSWYAPYKPVCDAIIVAFVYAVFILNLIRKITPELLNGSSGTPVNSDGGAYYINNSQPLIGMHDSKKGNGFTMK